MGDCCYPGEYSEMFNGREAARVARGFRKRGLRSSAAEVVGALVAAGITDADVLEVGGGVGHIQVALLEAGAASAINIDLSASWEDEASVLLSEHGLSDRVERRLGNIVDDADGLPMADVVILHKVVCCYPDAQRMLAAASGRSRRLMSVTIPKDRWWTRAFVAVGNALLAVRGKQFRAFVHPLEVVRRTMGERGFTVRDSRTTPVWSIYTFERTGSAAAPNG